MTDQTEGLADLVPILQVIEHGQAVQYFTCATCLDLCQCEPGQTPNHDCGDTALIFTPQDGQLAPGPGADGT